MFKALEAARQSDAKTLELRVALDLCRFWQQRGQGEMAQSLLAPLYDWVNEGLDTNDLRDAKVILNELAE
ncbi:hypothetical protein C2W62_12270 [Candidatus Entotheonella serta]|nr:hypothetical protein C2W62_12270 [Candidatus Entotheonella serta]